MKYLLPLFAAANAVTWQGQNLNLTVSWPGNDDRAAGGIVTFDSGAGQIANGTGSCDVTINTAGVNFVHFFNAHHAGAYDGSGTWTIAAPSNWEDQGQYQFLFMADDEPDIADISVECQDDSAIADGTVLLSSFPADPSKANSRGSFTFVNGAADGVDAVTLNWDVGMGATNVTCDDESLTVSNTGDAWTISGVGAVNYDDIWCDFEMSGVGSYEITAIAS
jgi:hypothetical protein